ncbi:RagB/SusD family nutrient uptake outer membrane protein [Arachidicoccus ginsenosidivorans]|jgi:hypothetical protein|uniref:RagB/SusD family nutrient uptake outer membrane protein n=1 Tax=Arachidicoccus ginsenosidivorans TaxID=496057 RepID=A0A5B8VLE1_9BACT|nr:RagB/SusD family nutrient uptake outer membrane protein [Arachidicoccus ginsenosidivorans]QEC71426.1 RagB/SusD family nutrient uptake outer membrane protein [Arachidicoccus ginsenosidivorans]
MKHNFQKIYIIWALVFAMTAFSCSKKLDRMPINTTSNTDVFSTIDGTKQALAKVYGAFALTGSSGSGSSDLGGIDAGTSDFLRLYWNAQELPTDEALCAWGDPGIPDLNEISWTSGNLLLNGLYNRCIYQITVANSFIRETENVPASFSDEDKENLTHFRAEARFVRAYQYWVLMDLFGNPPFTDENSKIGKIAPPQIKRADLFTYIESELKAIEPDLVAPKQNEYGRADQAADWALLARLYLNAAVYTGTDHYTDAITYSEKVINSGYSLDTHYNDLFLADNNVNNPETILSINYDGNETQNYGGTTFLVNACIDGSTGDGPDAYGVPAGGWGGIRARSPLPKLFGDDYTASKDKRAALMLGTEYDITNTTTFAEGVKVIKFRNTNSDGSLPANASTFVSTDFPLFRLAEQYLIYAEAVLRGGTGGDKATAISYINKLRERAYGNTSGNVANITLPFILDERARELYYEGFRRTDLIRFGEFTGSAYIWPWKGGIKDGTSVADKYNLFPIPASDVAANPDNLTQNPGYGN